MMHKITLYEQIIDAAIKKVLVHDEPRSLFEPVTYTLSLGGKRIRPLFSLLAADLFGEEPEIALNPAIAIEIFHNFSLLHDDLMDRADVRRGHPTVHKKWNANTAILSGDAMMIEAYKCIARVPSRHLPSMLELFSTTAMQICKGQQYDMDFEQRMDVTEEEYLHMIKLKTAVLIGCALKMGAIVVNAPSRDAEALYDYGINIGLAFQLKDDLLDVYGAPETFGKKIGGDILSNKKTFLLINALKQANPAQRSVLDHWLDASEFDPAEKISAVKKIYDELNLHETAESLIEKYYLASLDYLSTIHVPDERKQTLRFLSESLMHREK